MKKNRERESMKAREREREREREGERESLKVSETKRRGKKKIIEETSRFLFKAHFIKVTTIFCSKI